jgi:hypothetical protein
MTVKNLAELDTDVIEGMFGYLDDLREGGITNMYGARAYLAQEYPEHAEYAGAALSAWMSTFSRDKTAFERALEAIDAEEA